MNIISIVIKLLCIATFLFSQPASTSLAAIYTINGKSGPWMWSNAGLNASYAYGVNDQVAPTSVTGLLSGQTVTVTYASGTVKGAYSGQWGAPVDANGDLRFQDVDSIPHGNGNFPAYYTSTRATTYYMQLIGVFANAQGQIVGTPFAVGNGPTTVTVPSGATALQLGINDNLFGDNTGAWNVNVQVVPEPSTLSVLLLGLAFLPRCNRKAA